VTTTGRYGICCAFRYRDDLSGADRCDIIVSIMSYLCRRNDCIKAKYDLTQRNEDGLLFCDNEKRRAMKREACLYSERREEKANAISVRKRLWRKAFSVSPKAWRRPDSMTQRSREEEGKSCSCLSRESINREIEKHMASDYSHGQISLFYSQSSQRRSNAISLPWNDSEELKPVQCCISMTLLEISRRIFLNI